MDYYYLEIIKGHDIGRRYQIIEGASGIGRGQSNACIVASCDKTVSFHHAIIYKNGISLTVQDLKSTNGTFVNEVRIENKNLEVGDILGLGKHGPRFKLIVSPEKLPESDIPLFLGQNNQPFNNDEMYTPTQRGSQEYPNYPKIPSSSYKNIQHDFSGYNKEKNSDKEFSQEEKSQTLDIEDRLLNKNLDHEEMIKLIQNKRRLEKIVNRGNISHTLSSLLLSAHTVGKKVRWRWIVILLTTSLFFALIIVFLSVRMIGYQKLLKKGTTLEQTLDQYEAKISQVATDSFPDEKKMSAMLKEIDDLSTEMVGIRNGIREKDLHKIYSDTIEYQINDILQQFGETHYHVPQQMIDRVRYHVNQYSTNLKPIIERYLQRKEIYFPMIQRIFREKKLPLTLSYLAMLESGYNPKALSSAGARGMWQFMPATGKKYNLKIDDVVDERTDPEKATKAAAEYLKDLISIFGAKSSTMLAMAAYNAGEGRLMKALQKIDDPLKNRDFWYLYRMGYLKEETNEYIPRVLALIIIDKNKQYFGFSSIRKNAISEEQGDFIELSK